MELKLALEEIESASFSASRDTIHNTGHMGHEKRIKDRQNKTQNQK